MTAATAAQAIVFDIGHVLVDLDFARLFDFLREHGVAARDSRELAAVLDYERYETGRMSDREFHAGILRLATEPFSFDDWRDAWVRILTPNTRMLGLTDRLARRHDVYILSNTNALHFDHMERTLRLTERFVRVVTSCEAGAMKPDPAIYAFAERAFGRDGRELVFFDDLQDNVDGALRAGWGAYLFQGYDTVLVQLREAGFDPGC